MAFCFFRKPHPVTNKHVIDLSLGDMYYIPLTREGNVAHIPSFKANNPYIVWSRMVIQINTEFQFALSNFKSVHIELLIIVNWLEIWGNQVI